MKSISKLIIETKQDELRHEYNFIFTYIKYDLKRGIPLDKLVSKYHDLKVQNRIKFLSEEDWNNVILELGYNPNLTSKDYLQSLKYRRKTTSHQKFLNDLTDPKEFFNILYNLWLDWADDGKIPSKWETKRVNDKTYIKLVSITDAITEEGFNFTPNDIRPYNLATEKIDPRVTQWRVKFGLWLNNLSKEKPVSEFTIISNRYPDFINIDHLPTTNTAFQNDGWYHINIHNLKNL